MTAMITPFIDWADNPTARSEKARLRNNFLIIGGIDEAFHRERVTKRFPRVATREKNKFKTQSVSIKVSLKRMFALP